MNGRVVVRLKNEAKNGSEIEEWREKWWWGWRMRGENGSESGWDVLTATGFVPNKVQTLWAMGYCQWFSPGQHYQRWLHHLQEQVRSEVKGINNCLRSLLVNSANSSLGGGKYQVIQETQWQTIILAVTIDYHKGLAAHQYTVHAIGLLFAHVWCWPVLYWGNLIFQYYIEGIAFFTNSVSHKLSVEFMKTLMPSI